MAELLCVWAGGYDSELFKIHKNFNKRQLKCKMSDAEKEDYRIGRQIWIIANPGLARNLRRYEDLSDRETTDDEHYDPEYGY